MKHFFALVAGLLIGVAAALAALYFNPLTAAASGEPVGVGDLVMSYSLPEQVLEFEIGEDAQLVGQPPSDDALWEETIDRAAVLGLVLNDAANQPVAVASRLLTTSPRSDLLLNGMLISDYTLVTVPGQGTLFVQADSNVWPVVKDAAPVWYLGRSWSGPADYAPTVGPDASGEATVIGLSGVFSGLESTATESYRLTALDRNRGLVAVSGELRVRLPAPAPEPEPQVAVKDEPVAP
jgi:hypothetical protein